jgi:hypothetical protein
MNAGAAWQWAAGLSALGFYFFLAVWMAAFFWSRTRERLATHETLQRLIASGTQLSPQVIDAIRRPRSARSRAETLARIRKFRYWGLFMIGLGTLIALIGLQYTDSDVEDLRDMMGGGIVLFVIPGLFLVAHSVISALTSTSEGD